MKLQDFYIVIPIRKCGCALKWLRINKSGSEINRPKGSRIQTLKGNIDFWVLCAVQESIALTVAFTGVRGWEPIDDSQTASWQNINNTQTSTWTQISNTQTANWQTINDSQTAGWGDINDTQTANWQEITT